jgi:hypothetical protein
MSELSTSKKLEEWITKPVGAGLMSWGLALLMEEKAMANIPFLGRQPLPVFYGVCTALGALITTPVAQFLMPHITSRFAVSNGVFVPLVAGGINQGLFYATTKDMRGFKPFINGVLGDIGGQYLEDNVLMKI